MPVHDWSRVGPRIFHDFHGAWITEIRNAMNGGLLPPDFYALTEQHAGDVIADVLTLQVPGSKGFFDDPRGARHAGATAVAECRPKVLLQTTASQEAALARQKRVVIRRAGDDQVVALVEIVSPGNKAGRAAIDLFVRKVFDSLERGWHMLIVDVQPPSPRDPEGIHGAIWPEVGGDADYKDPAGKPLTLVAYEAAFPKNAYIEPIAVGDELPEMPVFLAPGWYVNVPLGPTYAAAWRGVPRRWRDVIEPPTAREAM